MSTARANQIGGILFGSSKTLIAHRFCGKALNGLPGSRNGFGAGNRVSRVGLQARKEFLDGRVEIGFSVA